MGVELPLSPFFQNAPNAPKPRIHILTKFIQYFAIHFFRKNNCNILFYQLFTYLILEPYHKQSHKPFQSFNKIIHINSVVQYKTSSQEIWGEINFESSTLRSQKYTTYTTLLHSIRIIAIYNSINCPQIYFLDPYHKQSHKSLQSFIINIDTTVQCSIKPDPKRFKEKFNFKSFCSRISKE